MDTATNTLLPMKVWQYIFSIQIPPSQLFVCTLLCKIWSEVAGASAYNTMTTNLRSANYHMNIPADTLYEQ